MASGQYTMLFRLPFYALFLTIGPEGWEGEVPSSGFTLHTCPLSVAAHFSDGTSKVLRFYFRLSFFSVSQRVLSSVVNRHFLTYNYIYNIFIHIYTYIFVSITYNILLIYIYIHTHTHIYTHHIQCLLACF